MKKILVIGAAGSLATQFIKKLIATQKDTYVVALDSRPITHFQDSFKVSAMTAHYKRSVFEKLFQEHHFDCVYHVGRISRSQVKLRQRLTSNLLSVEELLKLCELNDVKKFVYLSTFHVYGALPDNPIHIREDSMLRATIRYPELRDVVEMDRIVSNWMWKNKESCKTVVLRPCNIFGKSISNSITRYLKSAIAPRALDFNPNFQFLSPADLVEVLLHTENFKSGIYNVSPGDSISIYDAISSVNANKLSMPITLLTPAVKLINRYSEALPGYLLDYLKYPVILDNQKILKQMPEDYKFQVCAEVLRR